MKKTKYTPELYKKIFWIGTITWSVFIFILCAMPNEDIPDPHLNIPHLDKVAHFGLFFILSVLLCYALPKKKQYLYFIPIFIALIYGGLLEILQYYFFNRSGDIWDLVADIAGGISGCLLFPPIYRLINKLFFSPDDSTFK